MDRQKTWNVGYWLTAIPAVLVLQRLWQSLIENTWFRDMLSWVLPTVILFAVWFFLIRRVAEKRGSNGLITLGQSRAKVYVEQDTGRTFADVAGVDEATDELRQLVEFLKDPKVHGRLGARLPKGVLLVGPPGTGKTLLARAVAGEARVSFFSICGCDFVEMFVGAGAARVRHLFEQARQKAPAIVFIDELDAIGRERGASGAGGHDEKERALDQLLVEMDGFDARGGVLIMAASNRPEILDPALLRAGRFERQVLVDLPDRRGRLAVLQVHARTVNLAPGLDLDQVAARTLGFSGADLATLVNEAALAATRRNAEAVTMADFTRALECHVAGLEKQNRVLSPGELEVAAYHQMGHALLGLALPGVVETVHKVSIIPRAMGTIGYALQRPTEDRCLMTREQLERKIWVLLGGCAAEQVVFGRLSTAAGNDLARATTVARDMVARYGMEPAIGHVSFEPERPFMEGPAAVSNHSVRLSEVMLHRIDKASQAIVERCFDRAQALLAANRDVLERSARALLECETLHAEELPHLARGFRTIKDTASQGNDHGATSRQDAKAETSSELTTSGW